MSVRDAEHDRKAAFRAVGPEPLSLPLLVVLHDRRGRPQDAARGAVVLLEADHSGRGEVRFESQDIADVGAAPRKDRLVLVTYHADVPAGSGKQPNDFVLRTVGVLELVD